MFHARPIRSMGGVRRVFVLAPRDFAAITALKVYAKLIRWGQVICVQAGGGRFSAGAGACGSR